MGQQVAEPPCSIGETPLQQVAELPFTKWQNSLASDAADIVLAGTVTTVVTGNNQTTLHAAALSSLQWLIVIVRLVVQASFSLPQ